MSIPVVFLHAFPLSHKMWEPNRAALSKNFRFITPDLPGFGAAPALDNQSDMKEMARRVLSELDKAGVKEKFIVGGLSMGGYVMLPLLQMAPERVRAAAFFSTRAGADSPEGREKRFKNIELVEKEGPAAFAEKQVAALLGKTTLASKPETVAGVKKLIGEQSVQGITAALRGMAARPDATEVVSNLKVPSLFISGAEDGIIQSSEMETLSKKAANSEFHVIDQGGHLINLEQPARFNDLVLHFLKRRVL